MRLCNDVNCGHPICNTLRMNSFKEEKQMGGEWFEWAEHNWMNHTKDRQLYIFIDGEPCVTVYLKHFVSKKTLMEKIFLTKDEALAFARDFMTKNGGIIE